MDPRLHILAFGFLAPLLMGAGAAATSIPIIIHLLNKRKFKIVIWAAMDWLLAAQRRNARRLKFQRWLLLAIRCLAILIIAAGIAQLVLQNSALGSLLGEQRAVVIIWDDSYSMGYQQDGAGGPGGTANTAFDHSKKLLSEYITKLRSGDDVLVIRASTAGPVDAANQKPTPDHQIVIQQINAARLTDAGTSLPEAFDRAKIALTELETKARARQLLLITDFSNSSIHDPKHSAVSSSSADANNQIEGINGEKLKKAVAGAIAHATEFHPVDLGVKNQTNMAITGLSTVRPITVAGAKTELRIEVFNASDQSKLDVNVELHVDGVPQKTAKIAKIDAASYQTVSASVVIPTVGRHLIEAHLPADLLPVDDTRRLMLNARKEISALLVEGNPGDGASTFGSVFFLRAVFLSPFSHKVVTELEFPTTPLVGYDIIVLSDTSVPVPPMREALEKFVKEGGLLIISPGGRMDVRGMNEAFGENGDKLLPATLGQLETGGADEGGYKFTPEGYSHPVLKPFQDDVRQGKSVGIDLPHTSKYLKLGVPVDGSVETILRFAKADGTPGDAAVVKKDVGKGKVVLFATSLDSSAANGWTDFASHPSFLPFMIELTYYAMSRDSLNAGTGLTLDVTQSILLPGDAAAAGSWNGPRDTQILVKQELKDGRATLNGPALAYAGTYTPTNGDGRPVIAVNAEAREADIRHVANEPMAAALGVDVKTIMPAAALSEWRSGGNEAPVSWLGPTLIAVALGLFILEAILALAFSTYR